MANKLSLNITKSNFILFHSPHNKPLSTLNLHINNNALQEKNYIKYLGIIIDKHLSWKEQTSAIKLKLSKILGLIHKAKHFAPTPVLTQIYYSFFYPYITYAALLWGNASPSILKPIITLQKKAVRVLANEKWNSHTPPIFYKLKLLKCEDIYKLQTALFMYDVYHMNIGETFQNMFTPISSVHNYNTRKSKTQHFFIKHCRTNYKKRFLPYNGIKIWGEIPQDIKNKERKTFKRCMMAHLINKYFGQ